MAVAACERRAECAKRYVQAGIRQWYHPYRDTVGPISGACWTRRHNKRMAGVARSAHNALHAFDLPSDWPSALSERLIWRATASANVTLGASL